MAEGGPVAGCAVWLAFGMGAKLGEVPTVLRVRGYRFFFFSLEGREPPHIHVANAGRYVAGVRGFRANEMTGIRRIVIENAQLFLEEWFEYFSGEN